MVGISQGSGVWKFRVFLKLLSIISALLYVNTSVAGNQEPDSSWEFTGQYQPDREKLWKFDGQFFDLTCEDRNDIMYENYARQHPEFRPLMGDNSLRSQWRYSLITKANPNTDSLNHCFYRALRDRWFAVTRPGNKKPPCIAAGLPRG